ncbi:hypothetical protein L798_13703 [Zootermopsis nevadensis]|uniref:Defensin n=1 Tax=Zootermopsis nevadensis TaxID=136037 RepID=A0A067QRV6_ZOONE|nr:hypothetical protein L798_13703 [Zootermopsis nevadensis]
MKIFVRFVLLCCIMVIMQESSFSNWSVKLPGTYDCLQEHPFTFGKCHQACSEYGNTIGRCSNSECVCILQG